jgi:putative thioredoxin
VWFSGDNKPVTLPSNFGRAIDLSGLGKAPMTATSKGVGREVTAANLAGEFVALSKSKVVILLCWSPSSPESLAVLEVLAKLQANDGDKWILGSVNIDAEPQVATALQLRTVPYAIALVAEQMIPLFEQSYPEGQVRAVVDKVLSIAAEQGIGSPLEEIMEPEEEEAFVNRMTRLQSWDLLKPSSLSAQKVWILQTMLGTHLRIQKIWKSKFWLLIAR